MFLGSHLAELPRTITKAYQTNNHASVRSLTPANSSLANFVLPQLSFLASRGHISTVAPCSIIDPRNAPMYLQYYVKPQ